VRGGGRKNPQLRVRRGGRDAASVRGRQSFDAVTMSYGLRNVRDYRGGARGVRAGDPSRRAAGGQRVFAAGERGVPARIRRVDLMAAIPAMARRFSSNPDSYVYLAESIQAWPDQRELAAAIRAAGWSDVQWRNLAGGIVALHRARRA
jgi:demethylmenaquinone methyltransferase/2-methoxy-6-polyprenyl-1,4-benzoquinol methylase